MTLAVIYSRASIGIKAPQVNVEAHISNGLPRFTIVGLPDTAVKESKDRVRSAIINSGFEFPFHRITINLAPADLPKDGGRFDLAIAIGILAASNQIPLDNTLFQEYEFAGELALSGELHPVCGTLPLALAARLAKRKLLLPLQNAAEAALPGDNIIYGAKHLLEVCRHLSNIEPLPVYKKTNTSSGISNGIVKKENLELSVLDLAEIRGQKHAKRALEIAAAGSHSLLMIGPPGTGKTMLASRLPSIMPPLTLEETLEVVAIHSLVPNLEKDFIWGRRPFRAPHHTASAVALVGGGSNPRPGEISLAHHGVLFLDELPEFDRKVLEVLREPLESGNILISRAARQCEFPALFQLIAAMNPCPCGYMNDLRTICRCTQQQVQRYRTKISGPLLDRIDMHIEVPALSLEFLTKESNNSSMRKADNMQKSLGLEEPSAQVLERVNTAVLIQRNRQQKLNARLSNRETLEYSVLNAETKKFMNQAIEKLGLSARAYHRILKVARTIADLENSNPIQLVHVTEALTFRKLDRDANPKS